MCVASTSELWVHLEAKELDDPSPLISEPYKKTIRHKKKCMCFCLIKYTAAGVVSCEHGLFSPYNVSSVGNNLLITKSLCCGEKQRHQKGKGEITVHL